MRASSSWAKDFWVELTKKSLKKDKFNISTPVDIYKSEFLKNTNITLYTNVLESLNLVNTSNEKFLDFPFKETNNNCIFTNTNDILILNLKFFKKNLSNNNKITFFNTDLLFENNSNLLLDQTLFKKTKLNHPLKDQNKPSTIPNFFDLELISSHDSLNKTTFTNFFENEILKNYKNYIVIQHPDLDDETRFVKRSSGKNIPLRILKYPTDILTKNSIQSVSSIDLLRFRFNDQNSTIANKPTKPTIYLTFKQKRYNQKNSIGRKSQMFFSKDFNNNQKYSGNPFLKDISIIEENFGNPTRQYRLVKKAKSRLDTTRIST